MVSNLKLTRRVKVIRGLRINALSKTCSTPDSVNTRGLSPMQAVKSGKGAHRLFNETKESHVLFYFILQIQKKEAFAYSSEAVPSILSR